MYDLTGVCTHEGAVLYYYSEQIAVGNTAPEWVVSGLLHMVFPEMTWEHIDGVNSDQDIVGFHHFVSTETGKTAQFHYIEAYGDRSSGGSPFELPEDTIPSILKLKALEAERYRNNFAGEDQDEEPAQDESQ